MQTIHLSDFWDNYSAAEDATACHRCLVICTITPNVYGNRLVQMENFLSGIGGTNTFVVYTLEEANNISIYINARFTTTTARMEVGA